MADRTPEDRGARAGAWLVALLAVAGAITAWPRAEAAPAPGVVVEVLGDVPRPGLWRVDPPTARAALAVAGVAHETSALIRDGDRILWEDGQLSVLPPVDALLFGRRVDFETAPVESLAVLPGLNPKLAAAIVADREERGPFGSIEALDRVKGIGPKGVAALRPHLVCTFFGPPAPPPLLDLNTASAAALEELPGIGPALAKRILDDRRRNGRYRRLADLDRVKGIGPAILARLRGRVRVGR